MSERKYNQISHGWTPYGGLLAYGSKAISARALFNEGASNG
jgi:hypothetical protein